jgi:cysteine desulfurase / selenocysteine lyase
MDVNKIREDFPILKRTMSNKPLIYLDNGATTLKPKKVIDAVTDYYTYLGANAHRGDYEMSAQVDSAFEGARARAQKYLNAKHKEEIVFTSGTSEGLNLVALMVTEQLLHEGNVILSDESEHASSILPWMQASKKKGTKIDYIPLDEEGKITIENFKSVLTDQVKVVCVAMVSNVLGFIAPIKEMAKICREKGILLVVDGAQSTPHLDIDVQDLDCDFYCLSSHKMCGPTGVGVLYGKKELLDKLEPVFYGGESNARFDKGCNLTLKETPLKYESGTQPIEGVIGMAAAMDYLDEIGKSNIHAHEVELKKYFIEKAHKLGNIIIYNENSESGIVTFNVKDQDKVIFAQDVASYLNTFGIAVRSGQHCAKLLPEFLDTPGTCRASFYLYNTKDEVDALIEALKNATIENCVGIFF